MLSDEQLQDIAQLHSIAAEFAADVAIIGAAALLCFIDLGRFTRDIDLVVALDLEDFAAFSSRLTTQGWIQERHTEHRWRGPRGSIIDLIPAGPNLRAGQRIVWPGSQFAMSLIGFDHVFARGSLLRFGHVQYKVAPPSVLALLKIVSCMDDPQRRQRDLIDVKALFRHYEADTERIFGDDVFAAELQDIEYANAFLLGIDVGAFATGEESKIVHAFLRKHRITDEEVSELDREDFQQKEILRFQQQLRAFHTGFDGGHMRRA